LWSRHFSKEVPEVAVRSSKLLILEWAAGAGAAHDEMSKFPDIKAKAEKEDYFIEVLDYTKDTVVGELLVKTNKESFRVLRTRIDGDWAAVSCSGDRVLLYSLTDGEEKGHVFGISATLSAAAGMYAVPNSTGQLSLYDLQTSQVKRQYQFPARVALQQFSEDGKRMFVLTSDQTAYVFDLTAN
jgi:WD40 repeat protein